MRCAIIFFSGTGNTEFVVKQFKRSLEEKRFQCSLVDIAKKKNFQDDYDFLVFGFPVHGGGLP